MASKNSFKPPVKNSKNPDIPRKKKATQALVAVSLSDEQYEEIFTAVIHPSQNAVDIKSPTIGTPADVPNLIEAASPKESASVENSQQNTQQETETATIIKEETITEKILESFSEDIKEADPRKVPEPFSEDTSEEKNPKKVPESSSLSTLHSDDITKEAVFSTPKPAQPKMKTFREALKSLKEKLTESFSECSSINESIGQDEITKILNEGQLSQVPAQCSRRDRLLWLQERRGTGLYARCDHISCRKWRWLDNPDPVDLPAKWYCDMNPDTKYASCSVREKPIPRYIEEDLIHNCYTAGSIVWARMPGYPWWPAMVDDCPDVEQYYWINNELDNVPDWYHVVFFDDREVTRLWLPVKNLMSFKHHLNLEKKFKLTQPLKKRINFAKQKANDALTLHVKDRLKKYSFISVWKKEIPDYPDSDVSDSEIDDADPNLEQKIKKKILARRRAYIKNKNNNTHSMNLYKMNDTDLKKSEIINSKNKTNSEKTAKVSDASKKPGEMRADTEKSESRKKKENTKVVKPAKIFNKKGVDSKKSAKETNKINKPSKVARRMSADSVISKQYIEEAQKMGKDVDMNEKPAQKSTIITRRMSAQSELSQEFPMTAVSNLAGKSTTTTSRMSVNSNLSDKSDKKVRSSGRNSTSSKKSARRVSKDSKISDKPARITRSMSQDSKVSETSSIIRRIRADFDSPERTIQEETVLEHSTSKKAPKKVTKPAKKPTLPARRHSEKSFAVIKPKKTENRKKSTASVPEDILHEDTSVKISKRKSISSPTFLEECRKKDESMAKRQKILEEKLEPSKMETIIKKVKKSFRPPIRTNLNQSSSTYSSMSIDE